MCNPDTKDGAVIVSMLLDDTGISEAGTTKKRTMPFPMQARRARKNAPVVTAI
jgi:hypothetical protein